MRKVPSEGDLVSWNCFRLEVADMDRARIDKVVVAKIDCGACAGEL